MKSLVIRADAGPHIGGGHIMRCLTVALEMFSIGWEASLIASSDSLLSIKSFIPHFIKVITIPSDRLFDPEFIKLVVPVGCDLLLIDGYNFSSKYSKSLRNWAKKIAVIDDLANRFYEADILLDQSFNRNADSYLSKTPEQCKVLVGSDYALLRSEFSELRLSGLNLSNKYKSPLKVLVSMGAADITNITKDIIEGIIKSDFDFEITLVTSDLVYQNLSKLYKSYDSINFLTGVKNMGQRLKDTDIAIGAAGGSIWERSCLAIPALVYIIADNQKQNAFEIYNNGLGMVHNWPEHNSSDIVSRHINDFVSNKNELINYSIKSGQICDGFGVKRFCSYLDPVVSKNGELITLRRVDANDKKIIYKWQCEPNIRRYSRNTKEPSKQDHNRWFKKKLLSHKSIIEIILCNGQAAGMIRLDPIKNNCFEISILISQGFQSRGIGRGGLKIIRRYLPRVKIYAEIHPENKSSINLFKSSGYKEKLGRFLSQPVI